MGTRTIRVRDGVYERLKARKRPGESLSEFLDRLTDRESDLETGFGAMADVDFEGASDELDERFDGAFRS